MTMLTLLQPAPVVPTPKLTPRPTPVRRATVATGRVIIVANRLPVTARLTGDEVQLDASSGGLATGLGDVHRRSRGLWIGWAGTATPATAIARQALADALHDAGTVGIPLTDEEMAAYYERVATGALWPRLHDMANHPVPTAADWAVYEAVNARFADAVAEHAQPGDQVWVHDYHLMLVPRMVRARRPDVRIGFFLHTPFPTPGALAALPQGAAILDGLLGADLVGLQTRADAERFTAAASALPGRTVVPTAIVEDERRIEVRACAMSIDTAAFAERAAEPRVAKLIGQLRRDGESLFVGVDRLDYTKGIPQRLAAFSRLLADRPELRGRVRLFQLAIPSREDVPAYRELRAAVEATVARINNRFGTPAWRPIDYVHGSVDAPTLSALYRAADVMLVTPLRDGMNLVAKEFVASRTDDDGVLVLSEHAGAAAELRAALLVDPRDVDALAVAYERALTMSPAERRVRMRRLRGTVQRHDVFQWSREFLIALGTGSNAERAVR